MAQQGSRAQFNMRLSGESDADLRELAKVEGKPEAKVVKDLVREALAARRAAQMERWGPRLFGPEEPSDAA